MRRLSSEVWWEDFKTSEDNVQQEMFLLSSHYDRTLSVLSNNLLGHLDAHFPTERSAKK